MVYVLYGMLVLKKVLCETNSLVAWNLTRDTSATWHPHAFILNQIKAFAREQWQLYFTHTMQEGNQCANWLAKHGSSSGITWTLWETCPQHMVTSLFADASGVIFVKW